jgi:hypothetical protein
VVERTAVTRAYMWFVLEPLEEKSEAKRPIVIAARATCVIRRERRIKGPKDLLKSWCSRGIVLPGFGW